MSTPSICIITAGQRSGTNLLRKSFVGTGKFVDYGEIFHDQSLESRTNFFSFKKQARLYEPTSANQRRLWSAYLEFCKPSAEKPALIDIKYNNWHHLDPTWQDRTDKPFLLQILMELNVPVIHLVRRNVVAQILSSMIAHANGRWHLSAEDPPLTVPTRVNPQHLIVRAEAMDRQRKMMRAFLQNYANTTTIFYEDLDSTTISQLPEQWVETVSALTSIPLEPAISMKLKKASAVERLITNLGEVHAALRRTQYSDQLLSAATNGGEPA